MKNSVLFLFVFFAALTSQASTLKTASLNLEGWADSSNKRAIKLNQLFQSQGIMKDVSFLMVQESIEYKDSSTAAQVAAAMGWKSFTQRRASDNEGLGFIYAPETQIENIQVYQIQARGSDHDYARMALSAQVKDKTWGLIRYVNTHLADQATMSATRKAQITEILSWLEKLEKDSPSQWIIFGGDFNTDVSSATYAGEFDLLTQSNFHFLRSPSEGSSYSWKDDNGADKALIDYFFLAPNATKTKLQNYQTQIYTQTIEQGISDHGLVVMTLNASGETIVSYSTVTDFAKFLGWSTSYPSESETW